MAEIYRDYGNINGYGNNTAATIIDRGQVYLATHEGGGNSRLPYMKRSFISFTYGGKHIEDFNLIATTVNNSLSKTGSAGFNDITTNYDILDGQLYWSTHYTANQIEFTLVTDGIDLKMLDDFLYWFRAGKTDELILAEHPNRGILARINNLILLNLLPFESTVDMLIAGSAYPTRTTLYKGEIILTFIMDDPHWYAINNILGKKKTKNNKDYYEDYWDDANGQEVYIYNSLDALKILYEDGIPLGSMILHNMLFGNGAYANVDRDITSIIWDPEETLVTNIDNLVGGGACISGTVGLTTYYGKIAGAVIDASGNGLSSLPKYNNTDTTCGYFYYSGTAPAPTIISFTMTPHLADNGYIDSPYNSYTTTKYNTITIESIHKQELHFTTPNLYTSFNKAISIFKARVKTGTTSSWEDVRQAIREDVRHMRVREWAIKVINDHLNDTITQTNLVSTILSDMSTMLKDSNGNLKSFTVVFNSETGSATATFEYRLVSSSTNLTQIEEDVGDMLRSNYITLRDRNYANSNGYITSWTIGHKEYSHRIYHNVNGTLTNFIILYKNMYL